MSINASTLKSVLHHLADSVVGAQHLHSAIDGLDQWEDNAKPAADPEPPPPPAPPGFEEVPGQPGLYRPVAAP